MIESSNDSISPKLSNMKSLRERFELLQSFSMNDNESIKSPGNFERMAFQNKLVLNRNDSLNYQNNNNTLQQSLANKEMSLLSDSTNPILPKSLDIDEDHDFTDIFKIPSLNLEDINLSELMTEDDTITSIKEEFHKVSEELNLNVSKVPESAIREYQNQLREELLNERKLAADKIKEKEKNLENKENMLKDILIQKEKEYLIKLNVEKIKLFEFVEGKRRDISEQFKRARDEFEHFISSKQAKIFELFGPVTTALTKYSLGQQLSVNISEIPQPVEVSRLSLLIHITYNIY